MWDLNSMHSSEQFWITVEAFCFLGAEMLLTFVVFFFIVVASGDQSWEFWNFFFGLELGGEVVAWSPSPLSSSSWGRVTGSGMVVVEQDTHQEVWLFILLWNKNITSPPMEHVGIGNVGTSILWVAQVSKPFLVHIWIKSKDYFWGMMHTTPFWGCTASHVFWGEGWGS